MHRKLNRDPAGIATGDKTTATDAAGNPFVVPEPTDRTAPDYAQNKKAFDDYQAQTAKEPLAVKLANTSRHIRIATNFSWTLLTGYLVLFMQAGFALLTCGLVRKKNAAHLIGFGVLVLGTIFPPLAYLCGWLCNMSFWLLEGSIDFAHRLPHFWLSGPADWWLWGFYGGVALLCAFPRIRPSRRWCTALLIAWLAVAAAAANRRHDRRQLDCTFVSVGHGCAVLLEFPSGRTMLYDAGQLGLPAGGVRAISGLLWSHGIKRLDAVVLSHADIDHYNALPGLLQKFSVGAIYVSPMMFAKENETLAVLRQAIADRCIPLCEVHSGDRLPCGEGTVEVLHPPRQGALGSTNASSLVLSVEHLGRRIILPGDLESPGMELMLAGRPLRCDVLLAPHHGSRKSNSPELARWCRPRWVVFSGDGRWNLPESSAPYRAVGAQVLDTSDCGAIHVSIAPNSIDVARYVPSQR